FCQVQEVNCPEGARETTLGCAPTENDQNPFAASGRQTLRGFFDTLRLSGSPESLFDKGLQSAARTICAPLAYKSHSSAPKAAFGGCAL
ncbi:MAG: hypothetical protein EGQ26_02995, partial [Clostridiales bacterium]|nr:hypothetical protein [Clostridiales bacterium]